MRSSGLETGAVGPHGLDLFGRFDQRLDAALRVAIIGVLHGHAHNRAGLEIDGMLSFRSLWQISIPVTISVTATATWRRVCVFM